MKEYFTEFVFNFWKNCFENILKFKNYGFVVFGFDVWPLVLVCDRFDSRGRPVFKIN